MSERGRGDGGDRHEQPQVALVEPIVRAVLLQHDGAEDLVEGDERRGEDRPRRRGALRELVGQDANRITQHVLDDRPAHLHGTALV